MKPLLSLAAVAALALISPLANAATCSPTGNCNACKNCRYCKNCSKNGGTCSVCTPRRSILPSRGGEGYARTRKPKGVNVGNGRRKSRGGNVGNGRRVHPKKKIKGVKN